MRHYNENNAQTALFTLVSRCGLSHDGDHYELMLALWGLGYMKDRPNPEDYGQAPERPIQELIMYAAKMAEG